VAQLHIAERSRLLCLAHKARKAKVDHKAQKTFQTEELLKATYKYGVLIAAVQEWLPVKWVQKEIAALHHQLLSDSEALRQEAKEVLDEIAKVQGAWKGPLPQGTAQRKLRKESLRSGAKRRVPRLSSVWWQRSKNNTDSLRTMEAKEAQEAVTTVRRDWEKHKKTEHVEEVRKEFVKEIKGLEPK
jgi:hypothetical protein